MRLQRRVQGAAITAALGGQAAAIIAWLASTHILFGEVTIATTALSGPSLAGNLVRGHRLRGANTQACEPANAGCCKAHRGPAASQIIFMLCRPQQQGFSPSLAPAAAHVTDCWETRCTYTGGHHRVGRHLRRLDARRAGQGGRLGQAAR